MIKIQRPSILNDVAAFIARLNSYQEHHIGYCGKKLDDIYNTLEENFGDVPARDAFFIATEGNKIVGACGFDADIERGRAEVWGPFIDHVNSMEIAKMLWETMIVEIPDPIQTIYLFPERRNETVIKLANTLSFDFVSKETILTCTNQSFRGIGNDNVITLSSEHYSFLVELHDQIFPDTYLSGEEMVKEISEQSIAFGVVDKDSNLLGYLYAEAEPEFGEGSIEFFGVNPASRNKGVGSSLLAKGVEWLFTFPSIEKVSLCVESDNTSAIRLYRSIGFEIEHQLTFYEKKLVSPLATY